MREEEIIAKIITICERYNLKIATAESLTCGLLAAAFGQVPGVSAVYLGGAVTYASETKIAILGVDAHRIEQYTVVDKEVAQSMAIGVAKMFGAQIGIATTGVAGPGMAYGLEPGTVWVAVSIILPKGNTIVDSQLLHLRGERESIRIDSVYAVLELILSNLAKHLELE